MHDPHTLTLLREYLDLCAAMKQPEHDADARRELSAQRTWTHNELIRVLGPEFERPFDMKQYARDMLG